MTSEWVKNKVFSSCQQKHSTTTISTKIQNHKITRSSHHIPSSNLFFFQSVDNHHSQGNTNLPGFHQASGCVLPSLNWLKAIAINEDPEATADCKAFCMGAVGSWNTSPLLESCQQGSLYSLWLSKFRTCKDTPPSNLYKRISSYALVWLALIHHQIHQSTPLAKGLHGKGAARSDTNQGW